MIPAGTHQGDTPLRESSIVTNDRSEVAALRNAEDRGESRRCTDDYDPNADRGYDWPRLAANFRLRNDLPEPTDPWGEVS